MLAKKRRITKKFIAEVVKKGVGYHSPNLLLKVVRFTGPSLFGFMVSKKVSKKAVERNLIKRRARYVIRKQLLKIGDNYLCVMMFKPGVLKLSFSELEEEMLSLLTKAKILKNK